MALRLLAVAAVLLALAAPAAAQFGMPRSGHHGIELVAAPPKGDRHFDVSIVGSDKGIDNLRAALDLLLRRSAFAAHAIETLKRNGRVVLVYDPNYPQRLTMGDAIAGFFPTYFRDRGDFLVVVSRHGIKWPTAELAAVLAHELAGHGIQHLRGDADRMRPIDRECEAWLYEEKAYQDLGVDKMSKGMVEFRMQLERRECSDFIRYQERHSPSTARLWEARNPDVTRLLAAFRDYQRETRNGS
jgi:hypothetical protein